jgi:hypothetical protein
MMILHVIEARYVAGHKVWLLFNDGASGEIDLSDALGGPVFQPLRDIAYFKRFKLRFHTLSWDNDADFAPEFLREKLAETMPAMELVPAIDS